MNKHDRYFNENQDIMKKITTILEDRNNNISIELTRLENDIVTLGMQYNLPVNLIKAIKLFIKNCKASANNKLKVNKETLCEDIEKLSKEYLESDDEEKDEEKRKQEKTKLQIKKEKEESEKIENRINSGIDKIIVNIQNIFYGLERPKDMIAPLGLSSQAVIDATGELQNIGQIVKRHIEKQFYETRKNLDVIIDQNLTELYNSILRDISTKKENHEEQARVAKEALRADDIFDVDELPWKLSDNELKTFRQGEKEVLQKQVEEPEEKEPQTNQLDPRDIF